MTDMLTYGQFITHSGLQLPYKIDCDSLTNGDLEALASIVSRKFIFSRVDGIPRGGTRFAEALRKYTIPGYPVLIVDDVLTTGRSMIEHRRTHVDPHPAIGVVIFARGVVPNWVWPIFTVNEWTQTRGSGIG